MTGSLIRGKRRIAVVGTSCTGKSTLAKMLGQALGIKFVDLDQLFWQPGWLPTKAENYIASVENELKSENWVISGNISSTEEIVLNRADAIVWLDYSLPVALARGLKRSFRRVILKEECCNGNFESLRHAFFSSNSILWWILKTHKRRRTQYLGLRERLNGTTIQFIRLARPKEAEKIISELKS